jgi:putative nucleotidyltransferase with HDIG domain
MENGGGADSKRESMQSIPIDEVLSKSHLPVDVFVCLASGKFLMVAKAGAAVETLSKFKERGVDRLFVRLEDYLTLVQKSVEEAASLLGIADDLRKFASVRDAVGSVYREIGDIGFDEEVFGHVKLVNHSTLSLMAKTPKMSELILKLDRLPGDGVKHAMMVSLTAAMLGVGHGWVKPGTIEKLALGGLLHDVGQARLPQNILDKPFHALTSDEQVILKGHSDVGAQLLAQAKSTPEDVILMVQEHHEYADGSGFPRGLKNLQINPLSKVVILANSFVDRMEKYSQEPASERAHLALERITKHEAHLFDRDALKALLRIFPGFEKGKIAG